MIVRLLDDLISTDACVETPNWTSRRLLLKRDGVGFSLHDTVIRAGTETTMWYKHHVEAVYCVEGEGTLEVLPEGPSYRIKPGTLYCLNGHERHRLRAITTMRMVCVFNPPCTGNETHDENGVYPLHED